MATYESIKYNFAGVIATGTIMSWSNSTVPSGFLECDGSAVSRTTYADLFAVVGTDYGSGDGSTTFNLPDMQDRTTVGASTSKSYSTTGGNESETPTGSVTVDNHTLTSSQMPTHSHNTSINFATCVSGANESRAVRGGCSTSNTPTFGSTSQGSSSAHNHSGSVSMDSVSVLQPYMALKFMIRT